MVFCQPLLVPCLPKKQDDYLQFLGVFFIKSIEALSGSKHLAATRAKTIRTEDKVYCSFLLMPHKQINMEKVVPPEVIDKCHRITGVSGGEVGPNQPSNSKEDQREENAENTVQLQKQKNKQYKIRTNTGRKRRCVEIEPEHDADNSDQELLTNEEEPTSWRTIRMDTDGETANYHMRIPFNTKMKGDDLLEEISQACDPKNLLEHFREHVEQDLLTGGDETIMSGR
jgi:hypothetical protein